MHQINWRLLASPRPEFLHCCFCVCLCFCCVTLLCVLSLSMPGFPMCMCPFPFSLPPHPCFYFLLQCLLQGVQQHRAVRSLGQQPPLMLALSTHLPGLQQPRLCFQPLLLHTLQRHGRLKLPAGRLLLKRPASVRGQCRDHLLVMASPSCSTCTCTEVLAVPVQPEGSRDCTKLPCSYLQ